jgi:sulfhydrogenase subunit beta (sulfur reductase)
MGVIQKIKVKNASITRANLLKLLTQIGKEKLLVAPVRNEVFGDVDFAFVKTSDQICFDYDNTVSSPKEFFFPNCEYMFTFERAANESIRTEDSAEAMVLFGIRSCDVKAIDLLDNFYERDFQDNYYLDKRRKSVIISVACSELYEQCFCTSTRTGPLLEEGFDIQLIPVGKRYAVQIGSEKGLELFEEYKSFFADGKKFNVKEFMAKVKNAELKFELDNVYKKLKNDQVEDFLWDDIAGRCQSCGLCLFLCPTCSCFSVIDKTAAAGRQRRVRQWDACYFRGFTRMAGGNDAVKNNQEMVQRKYQHKLLQQVDEFGTCGCVGCGRCNLVCVGNVNWLENIKKIDKGA